MPDSSLLSRLPRDPLRLALGLLVFITIGRAHMHFGLEILRPGALIVGFALVYSFINPRAATDRFLGTWQGWLVPAIALIALASLPFGLSPGASAQYFLNTFSKVLGTALILLAATRGVFDSVMWVAAYVGGCAMLVWYSMFVFDLSTAGSRAARLNDLYTYDANDVGLLLVVGIPLCMWLFDGSRGIVKLIPGIVLAGCAWSIALTGSRGAFLALMVVGLGTLVIALGRISVVKRVAALSTLGVVLVLAAPPGYWDQMATMFSADEDYNWTAETGRKAIALRGVDYMLDYPLSGIGLNNFGRAEGTISSMATGAMPGQGVPWTAPHNSYVQVGAELGIPGVLVFGTLVFGGIIGMYRTSRRASRRWRDRMDERRRQVVLGGQYLALAFLGFSIGAFFLSFAYLDLVYLLTAMSVGVGLEDRRLRVEDSAAASSGPLSGSAFARVRGGLATTSNITGSDHPSQSDDVFTPES